ncbi:hypothetical protein C8J56DRAFT_893793 [Mycena floridula]|nr:hypothetical protein C8J56DRAFT_893793 [Mycena floridula]
MWGNVSPKREESGKVHPQQTVTGLSESNEGRSSFGRIIGILLSLRDNLSIVNNLNNIQHHPRSLQVYPAQRTNHRLIHCELKKCAEASAIEVLPSNQSLDHTVVRRHIYIFGGDGKTVKKNRTIRSRGRGQKPSLVPEAHRCPSALNKPIRSERMRNRPIPQWKDEGDVGSREMVIVLLSRVYLAVVRGHGLVEEWKMKSD